MTIGQLKGHLFSKVQVYYVDYNSENTDFVTLYAGDFDGVPSNLLNREVTVLTPHTDYLSIGVVE